MDETEFYLRGVVHGLVAWIFFAGVVAIVRQEMRKRAELNLPRQIFLDGKAVHVGEKVFGNVEGWVLEITDMFLPCLYVNFDDDGPQELVHLEPGDQVTIAGFDGSRVTFGIPNRDYSQYSETPQNL